MDIKNLDDSVRISVKDTGIGIKEDKHDEIFERFRQADNLFTRKTEGSGIGLSLVKSLVEMHGGEICVKSQSHKGSEFIVEIPANLIAQSSDKDNKLYNKMDEIVQKIQVEFSDIYF